MIQYMDAQYGYTGNAIMATSASLIIGALTDVTRRTTQVRHLIATLRQPRL